MGCWYAFGLVWDRNTMFYVLRALERDQRAGFIRRDYTKPRGFGMCQTFRRISDVESPAGTGTGKPRRVARPRALAMAAERTKSRGEEAKTRAVAESTSITTTIAHRSRAPSYASPRRTEHNNGVTIARRHATANARDRHHHHRSCDRDRDHARDRSEHCAPNCHCGESISSSLQKSISSLLQKTRHYPLSCSHHHHRFQTAQTAPLGPVCRQQEQRARGIS